MENFSIKLRHTETKVLFENAFIHLNELHSKIPLIIITDDNLFNLYSKQLAKFKVVIIESGEKSKSLETFETVFEQFIETGVDRNYTVVGFGGGVVCDIAGLVTSVFYRGLKHILCPTSLLAQVDASIGGKTGINFKSYKNVLGTFNHPEKIIIDYDLLNTLPKEQFINGFAEIIKTSLIADKTLFNKISNLNFNSIKKEELLDIICRVISIKSKIVELDENEKGIRSILNFGHTFGHAIESHYNIQHGLAVSYGMVISLKLSEKICDFNKESSKIIITTLENFNLPTIRDFDFKKLINSIYFDKKKIGDSIKFILLQDIGKPKIKNIEINELNNLLRL